eukprot:767869-Hanusia_phi.AAC.4
MEPTAGEQRRIPARNGRALYGTESDVECCESAANGSGEISWTGWDRWCVYTFFEGNAKCPTCQSRELHAFRGCWNHLVVPCNALRFLQLISQGGPGGQMDSGKSMNMVEVVPVSIQRQLIHMFPRTHVTPRIFQSQVCHSDISASFGENIVGSFNANNFPNQARGSFPPNQPVPQPFLSKSQNNASFPSSMRTSKGMQADSMAHGGGNYREPGKVKDSIRLGTICRYKDRDGSHKEVQVVAIDRTLDPPSYCIRLPDGRERETEAHRLEIIRHEELPPDEYESEGEVKPMQPVHPPVHYGNAEGAMDYG